MRIDAHVHYTPPSILDDLTNFTRQEPYWGLLLAPNSAVQGWATAEQMIADMDSAGLDKVVLVGEYFQQHGSCVTRNNQAIKIINRWPNQVMAFAVIQPKAGQQALDELKRCVDNGLCGVGELNPYAQGYTLDDPDFLRLVELCIELNLPLNLHVSEEVGHTYPGKSTTPLRHYYQLAQSYPELKLILAHWGGGLFFYELMPKTRQVLQNVWYDTAASPLLYPTAKIFQTALLCVNQHKILYGSDYPLRLYPGKQPKPDFAPFLSEIAALKLPDDIMDDIMGNNIARLLELSPTDTPIRHVDMPPTEAVKISGTLPVSMVAREWPQTQETFEKYGIPWRDSPVPAWEPIAQAAAARGLEPVRQQALIEELVAKCEI